MMVYAALIRFAYTIIITTIINEHKGLRLD